MIGLYSEPLPDGFRIQRDGLPDFRSDGVAPAEERPFLHRGLPPEMYTPEGMEWIRKNGFATSSCGTSRSRRSAGRRCESIRAVEGGGWREESDCHTLVKDG